jgi:single stranded DNA-binding protein
MTYFTNTVTLIGNIGDEVRIIDTGDKTFASLSIATSDSYKDKEGNFQNKATIWHQVIVFNPILIKALEAYKKGTRLKITGSLSYRDFEALSENGVTIKKREASIIAGKVEQAPLIAKNSS